MRPRLLLVALSIVVAVALGGLSAMRSQPPSIRLLEPPGRELTAHIDGDSAILVNGRRVTPAGRVVRTGSYAWGLAVTGDGSRAALMRRDAIEFVGLRPPYGVRRASALHVAEEPERGSGAYMGGAFSPDGTTFYYGSADEGRIVALDVATLKVSGAIDLNGGGYADSFVGDLALSRDGRRLLAVDQFNYRLAIVDVRSRRVTRSVRVGRNPFAVAFSPDERSAWVSNVGMFEYPLVPGVTESTRRTAGLPFPPFGVPSKEADEALGSPNHPDAMSVFKVDLESGAVTARIKTGYLVGVERDDITTVGGASPGAVVAGSRFVYVANATNDTISILEHETGNVAGQIELNVPGLERLRGVLPFGMALTSDETRLYVACAGLNAVAVVDVRARRVDGYIPAGWFASILALAPGERTLLVSSAKGLGSGPNGGRGFVDPPRGAHPGDIMQGTLQMVDVPDAAALAGYTMQVVQNTYVARDVAGDRAAKRPLVPILRQHPIRHVVFIVKENRTFDQVYGQRVGLRGDPTIAELGVGRRVTNKDRSRVLDRVDISPNHQALADRFAISDNFYCDSDQSNTGHRWVVGVYPNEWVEVNARSRIEPRLFSSAPGRRYVAGSSATVLPEDYNEAGALWEQLARHRITFFNFGFGTEMPASLEEQAFKDTGIRMSVSFPIPKPLFDRTSRTYPTFNMAIPDQYRVDEFERELGERWASGREPFPQLVTMVLPNDHLTDEHPADGYPFRESYMADNDLALGRVMHTLSHSRWWPEMLVIIAEDDPQGGRDHVDAHRSILMLAGPHVRRGYVSRTLASFGSIARLIFVVLGLPALNQFDGAASLPLDFFAETPDATPYTVRPVDPRLFNPATALKPFQPGFNYRALASSPVMDDPDDMRRGFARPAR